MITLENLCHDLDALGFERASSTPAAGASPRRVYWVEGGIVHVIDRDGLRFRCERDGDVWTIGHHPVKTREEALELLEEPESNEPSNLTLRCRKALASLHVGSLGEWQLDDDVLEALLYRRVIERRPDAPGQVWLTASGHGVDPSTFEA